MSRYKVVYKALILLYIGITTSNSEKSPVFIIDRYGTLNLTLDPLRCLSKKDFGKIVNDTLKEAGTILIFVDNSLSTKDMMRRDGSGLAFQNLNDHLDDYKVKYAPAVDCAFGVIRERLPVTGRNRLKVNSETPTAEMFPGRKKYYYVYFKDFKEMFKSRTKKLREHDIVIKRVYNTARAQLQKPVVGFYLSDQSAKQDDDTGKDTKGKPVARGEDKKDDYHTAKYMPYHIVAGLFVVAIMIMILFYGVIMIMDIRTYDKFEDPHGASLSFVEE